MEPLFEIMVKEVPNLGALILLVWMFLRHMENTRQALIATIAEQATVIKENTTALHNTSEMVGRVKEIIDYLERRHAVDKETD